MTSSVSPSPGPITPSIAFAVDPLRRSQLPCHRGGRARWSHASADRGERLATRELLVRHVSSLNGSNDVVGWVEVRGDDDHPDRNPRVAMQHRMWEQMASARTTNHFVDAEFPPGPRAVDGRREDTGVGHTDYFKATMSEISKAAVSTSGIARNDEDEAPLCLCGQPTQLRRVNRRGPTFGRPYFACPTRACRFFEFADRGSTLAAMEFEWKRFSAVSVGHAGTGSGWVVVSDSGFQPEDLQQGGVGDCWFMSALAVVSERHDLMAKVVPNVGVAGPSGGCHEIRLFLDGHWTSLLIDDYLPTTTKQRRPTADGSGLAFGRCARHQLWVSFVEKAYAKAHGAYNAISGGEIAEALLDLTGAPTEIVQFRDPSFDKELFWVRMVSLLDAGCLIGCGTSTETIEELGLVGQHAYSVLEARDEFLGGLVRSVRVRNPWGEWTSRENDEMLAQLGVPVSLGDGCFWMRYEDFIRGFAVADICHARQGWHGRSFDAEFEGQNCSVEGVGSRTALRVRTRKVTECWFMAMQPTERGKRLKRPRGYYLNDISLLLVAADTGEMVGLTLGGAQRDVSLSVLLDADREYMLIPFSFKSVRGPFALRVYVADVVSVQKFHPSDPALVWASLHHFVSQPTLPPRTQRLVHMLPQNAGRVIIVESPAMALGFIANEHGTVALSIFVAASGNHAVVRTSLGQQDGEASVARNSLAGKHRQEEPSRRKGPREPKPDWRDYLIEVTIPPMSLQLAWVAVALVTTHWEFSLETLTAEQLPFEACSTDEKTGAAQSRHPFTPRPLHLLPLWNLSSFEDAEGSGIHRKADREDAEELEIMAAIAASVAETSGEAGTSPSAPRESLVTRDFRNECDEDEDFQLQVALAASRAETDGKGVSVVAKVEEPWVIDGASEAETSELMLAVQLSRVEVQVPADVSPQLCQAGNTKQLSTVGVADTVSNGRSKSGRWARRAIARRSPSDTALIVEAPTIACGAKSAPS
eukprot:TRINITY_DN61634_c0_g1_i1.p1 TRINITY_DN61634_c0_g1~~TRINITY_DN61634_c0_g1_i1.p1  ORF type:complete len:983 (+),score=121.87 TRINITY_DN61634_c0_g1_i1:211-3159(+)